MKIGEYLLKRLKDYGVTDIFGVPGDYNLGIMDVVSEYEGINWIGNCNELIAAYAADGYAREKGMGALITTLGVGELSAINGVAGSYAEDVPVIQITGISSVENIIERAPRHHTLGDGDYGHFRRAYEEFTVYDTVLSRTNAKNEIDKALSMAMLYKKPVYIAIPEDIVTTDIEETQDLYVNEKFNSSERNLEKFIEDFKVILKLTKEHLFVFGHFIERYRLQGLAENLIEKAEIPFTTITFGKSVITDDNKFSAGLYSDDNTICKISDLNILVGTKPNEWFKPIAENIVRINPFYCEINNVIYSEIFIEDAIKAISEINLDYSSSYSNYKHHCSQSENIIENKPITCDLINHVLQKHLKKNMNVVVEQGTAFFSSSDLFIGQGVKLISQPLWASIGYTLGSVMGLGIADRTRRNILLIGDGSFQLTAQAISTILREKLNPIIIFNDNGGYTIERYIAGAHKKYNDVQKWNYSKLIESFDVEDDLKPVFIKAETTSELDSALMKAEKESNKLVFIEIVTDEFEAPKGLVEFSKINAPKDRYLEGVNNQDLPDGILSK